MKKIYTDYLNMYSFKFKKATDGNYYFYSMSYSEPTRAYNEPTSTTITNTEEKNPKTSDVNAFEYIGIVLCAITILGISIKKVKALK